MVQKEFWFKLIIVFLVSAFSYFGWSVFSQVSITHQSLSIGDVLNSYLFIILTVALFIFIAYTFSFWQSFFFYSVYFLIFFVILGFKKDLLILFFIGAILFAFAYFRIEKEKENSVKIQFRKFVFFGAPTFVTLMSLFAAFAVFYYPINLTSLKVTNNHVQFFVPIAERAIKSYIPFYDRTYSIDDLIAFKVFIDTGADIRKIKLSQKALYIFQKKYAEARQNPFYDPVNILSDDDIKKYVLPEIFSEVKKRYPTLILKERSLLEDNLGVKLKGDEKIEDIMVKFLNTNIERYVKPNKEAIPLVLSFVVFLGVKMFSFIISRVSVFLTYLIFIFSKRLGFIQVTYKDIKKEVPVIKI